MNFTKKRLNLLLSLLLCVSMTSLLLNPSWNLSAYSFGHWNLRLCSCVRCLRDGDPWFRALIEASPKPFLSRRHRTSETDFDWWKRLQQNCSFTFFSATVDRLLETLPLASEGVEPRPDRCRTCAVVGNSGNLKGSHYGPLIDAHDVIIRINRGQTKGYETDVGTKTTHHVMYPESAIKLHNTTSLVFFAFKIDDLLWLLESFSPGENGTVNSRSIANKNLVMILNPAFMKYVHEDWLRKNGAYPSTGFLTLALSLQICDEVNVFGFGADKDGNWGHYFEHLTVKGLGTGVHAGKYEYSVIQQLHKMHKITFYKGD